MKKINHCCKLMDEFLEDLQINIHYNSRFREYGTFLSDSPAVQGILYCPWCGRKLPDSLRDDYFEILKKEYNIIADIFTENIPEEFKSDEWWKKRGL